MTESRRTAKKPAGWKVWLGIAVVFSAGTICGAVGVVLYIKAEIAKIVEGGPDEVRSLIVRRLEAELGLTKEQSNAIEPIVGEIQGKLIVARKPLLPVLEQLVKHAEENIRPELTGKQHETFDHLIKTLRIKIEQQRDWIAEREEQFAMP